MKARVFEMAFHFEDSELRTESVSSEFRRFRYLWLIAIALGMWVTLGANAALAQTKSEYDAARAKMVDLYVEAAGVKDERVLKSMRETPRHEFMPAKVRSQAYLDAGVLIGEKQTISSPFIVAYMTESLSPQETDKVLEIGTGSGYQAAVLSPIVSEVYTIEIVEPLGKRAAKTLERLNYKNVFVKIGDGFQGWAEHAPFDKIIVTCSPESVPQPLIDQLNEGGLMVVPVGERYQQTLYLFRKKDGKLEAEALRPTLFVPMTGTAEDNRKVKPDPSNPNILNGDFEDELDEKGNVPGWYYQRLLTHNEDAKSPSGSHYVTFENDQAGIAAHLIQGFPIDGRKVSALKLRGAVKYDNVQVGLNADETAMIGISFYDDSRADMGLVVIGPFRGTADWANIEKEVRVPKQARDAIIRIGLFGATGKISFDRISISPISETKKK
jgi:protein-L-isoaspartate(D-aspartate) O-methyltransferase